MDNALTSILAALSQPLALSADIGDARPSSELKDLMLQRQILGSYRDQLSGLSEAEAKAWTLAHMAELEAKLITLQYGLLELQAKRDPTLARPSAPELAKIGTYASVLCDDAMVQSGFYNPERVGDGPHYRWIGPDPEAWVMLPEVQTPFEVRLHVYSVFLEPCRDTVQISVNDGPWIPAVPDGRSGGFVMAARPEIGLASYARSFKIGINVGSVASPADRGQADDRKLSISLRLIEIRSISNKP